MEEGLGFPLKWGFSTYHDTIYLINHSSVLFIYQLLCIICSVRQVKFQSVLLLVLIAQAITATTFNNMLVGKRNDIDAMWGHFVMDEFYFWDTARKAQIINDFYLGYQWGEYRNEYPYTLSPNACCMIKTLSLERILWTLL